MLQSASVHTAVSKEELWNSSAWASPTLRFTSRPNSAARFLAISGMLALMSTPVIRTSRA